MTTIHLDDDIRATLRKLRLSTFADTFFALANADEANTELPEEIFLKAVEETAHKRRAQNITKPSPKQSSGTQVQHLPT